MSTSSHYDKEFEGRVDIYRICRLYDINDPAIYHAIKKLLRLGEGDKSKREDIRGAITSLNRWLQMEDRDSETKDNINISRIEEITEEDRVESMVDKITDMPYYAFHKLQYKAYKHKIGHLSSPLRSQRCRDNLKTRIERLSEEEKDTLDEMIEEEMKKEG